MTLERGGADDVTVALAVGERLLDACDAARAPIPFGCRGASCGTCRVEVVAGASHLEPAAAGERETLAALRVDDGAHRLACQIVGVRAGAVRLRVLGDVDAR
ncbi:MAG TPA: 2Fe-2S iron-sulfur cluster-binding protein [Byssovorax sp.]